MLMSYLSMIFFMAEGNYPFASLYIPLSMGIDVPFPAWPMRVGCAAGLGADLGVKVAGNVSDVKYTVELGAFKLAVDWAEVTGSGAALTNDQIDASGIFELVRVAVGETVILLTLPVHAY